MHKGKVTRLDLGMRLSGVPFSLTREGPIDRIFKALGFSEEIQTGDSPFDGAVYIACDHPALASLLSRDAAARGAILAVLSAGFEKITSRGPWSR